MFFCPWQWVCGVAVVWECGVRLVVMMHCDGPIIWCGVSSDSLPLCGWYKGRDDGLLGVVAVSGDAECLWCHLCHWCQRLLDAKRLSLSVAEW